MVWGRHNFKSLTYFLPLVIHHGKKDLQPHSKRLGTIFENPYRYKRRMYLSRGGTG